MPDPAAIPVRLLAVATAVPGVVAAVLPWRTWSRGDCGWTCYLPLSSATHPVTVRPGGPDVASTLSASPVAGIAVLLVAVLAAAVVVRRPAPGRAVVAISVLLTAASATAGAWAIARLADGTRELVHADGGYDVAGTGAGEVVAIVAAVAGLVLAAVLAAGVRSGRPTGPASAGAGGSAVPG